MQELIIRNDTGFGKDTIVETSDGVVIPYVRSAIIKVVVDRLVEADLETVMPAMCCECILSEDSRERMIKECTDLLVWLNAPDTDTESGD